MSLALDDAGRGSDPLLSRLRELTDVVAQQNATIAALRIERDTVRSEHEAAQAEIEKLRLLIRQLQRNRFGRRSERLDPDQLQLGLEDLEQAAAAAEAAQEEAATRSGTPRVDRPLRSGGFAKEPEHLRGPGWRRRGPGGGLRPSSRRRRSSGCWTAARGWARSRPSSA